MAGGPGAADAAGGRHVHFQDEEDASESLGGGRKNSVFLFAMTVITAFTAICRGMMPLFARRTQVGRVRPFAGQRCERPARCRSRRTPARERCSTSGRCAGACRCCRHGEERLLSIHKLTIHPTTKDEGCYRAASAAVRLRCVRSGWRRVWPRGAGAKLQVQWERCCWQHV